MQLLDSIKKNRVVSLQRKSYQPVPSFCLGTMSCLVFLLELPTVCHVMLVRFFLVKLSSIAEAYPPSKVTALLKSPGEGSAVIVKNRSKIATWSYLIQ